MTDQCLPNWGQWRQGRIDRRDNKKREETFQNDGYVLYLDSSSGFMNLYTCQNM